MKLHHFLLVMAIVMTVANSFAQVPQLVNYQAVARNSAGNILSNTNINVRFTVRQGSGTGTIVYQETQATATNQFGLFTTKVGGGTAAQGNFAAINWATGSKYLQVEIDIANSGTYTDMGNAELLSVPYALYAANGTIGPTGATGVTGAQGITGLQGVPGAQGATGTQGITGAQGAAGQQGVAGPSGATGDIGPQGVTGATGSTGATGYLQDGVQSGNTPYWNGTAWVTNNSNIYNNGNHVGVGTSSPASSAALDVHSTTGGLLLPRMTTAQRDAIANPEPGLVVFNTDNFSFQGYRGSKQVLANATIGNAEVPAIDTIGYGGPAQSFQVSNIATFDSIALWIGNYYGNPSITYSIRISFGTSADPSSAYNLLVDNYPISGTGRIVIPLSNVFTLDPGYDYSIRITQLPSAPIVNQVDYFTLQKSDAQGTVPGDCATGSFWEFSDVTYTYSTTGIDDLRFEIISKALGWVDLH